MARTIVKVRFDCPSCQYATRATLTAPVSWQCPNCDHVQQLTPPPAAEGPEGTTLSACAVCGQGELYKKKGFPHWLGLLILALACVGFLALHASYQVAWAWVVLIGSAILDGALYLLVRDVVVCYNCEAEHHGLKRSGNKPFELTIHERYRQQRLRRQQLEPKR
jgi:hypothetical protein